MYRITGKIIESNISPVPPSIATTYVENLDYFVPVGTVLGGLVLMFSLLNVRCS